MGLDSLLSNPLASNPQGPSSLGPHSSGLDDLLGGLGLSGPSSLGSSSSHPVASGGGGLDDLFSLGSSMMPSVGGSGHKFYSPPKEEWLSATKAKGLEILGTWTVQGGVIYADMKFTNRAMQPLTAFAIQFNKNSFGLVPAGPLNITTLQPSQSIDVMLPVTKGGPIQRMEPLNNLQVAIKNNVQVFYFSCTIPFNAYFGCDGNLEARSYIEMWKAFTSTEVSKNLYLTLSPHDIQARLQANNIFIAKEVTLDGIQVLYCSIKLINNIYVLLEVKFNADGSVGIAMNATFPDVLSYSFKIVENILSN
jgi:hypothetical protein